MFCSKCGKTIHPEDTVCPSCNAEIGDNRFGGIPYTSAQFIIKPGQQDAKPEGYEPQNNYTRTTYTHMENAAQEDSEIDSRTTYRPVYDAAAVPKEMRDEMRAEVKKMAAKKDESVAETRDGEAPEAPEAPARAPRAERQAPLSAAAKETLNEIDIDLQPDEEIDREQFRVRPIQTKGRAGISEDVSEYIRKLENGQGRRASRRTAVYDDYADPEERSYPQDDIDAAEGDEVYDDNGEYEEYPEDDYDEAEGGRRFGIAQILKILAAVVVVAAIAFGIVKWVGYIRGKQPSAPIEGVSKSLYEDGIAMIKSHTESDYINNLIQKYTSDGIISMSASLENDNNALTALMPEAPAANDSTFMTALQSIQGNIASAITMDALAVGSDSATAVADSEARWQIVNNSIQQLEGATSAAELTAVINGQSIIVQTETPEPTQAVVTYTSLQKGDENNDVLSLQLRLYALGYLTDKCDGAFGSKTQTAVKYFQKMAGLNQTGIADNETQTALYADTAPYAPGAVTPTPGPQPTPEPAPAEELPDEVELGEETELGDEELLAA